MKAVEAQAAGNGAVDGASVFLEGDIFDAVVTVFDLPVATLEC